MTSMSISNQREACKLGWSFAEPRRFHASRCRVSFLNLAYDLYSKSPRYLFVIEADIGLASSTAVFQNFRPADRCPGRPSGNRNSGFRRAKIRSLPGRTPPASGDVAVVADAGLSRVRAVDPELAGSRHGRIPLSKYSFLFYPRFISGFIRP